jgi:hypothetical protein
MAMTGLNEGLSNAFGLLGQYFIGQQKRQDDEASEARKLQLKNKLEMDLMRAKFEFAKANPTYTKYMSNLSGDIIGFDQFGSPHVVYNAKPEERALKLGKAQADIDKANATSDEQNARMTLLGAQTDLAKKNSAYKDWLMAHPEFRAKNPPKAPPDKYAKDRRWFDKEATRMARQAYPGGADFFDIAKPEKKQKAIDASIAQLKAKGYHEIPPTNQEQSPYGLGAFSGLVGPSQDDVDDNDDSGDEDNGYVFDPLAQDD